MAGQDTELTRLGVQSPYVGIEVSDYGTITAHLRAYREKDRGGTEEITLKFKDLNYNHLSCIARSAINAMRSLRAIEHRRIGEAIEWATGWNEGDGPSSG